MNNTDKEIEASLPEDDFVNSFDAEYMDGWSYDAIITECLLKGFLAGIAHKQEGWVSVKDKPEHEYNEPEGTRALMYGHDKFDESDVRYGFGMWEPAVEGRHSGRFYGLHANTHFQPTHIMVLRNNVFPPQPQRNN